MAESKPDETTRDAIKAVIRATENSYAERDKVLLRIWDKYRVKKTRTSETPYERTIVTPIVPDAIHDLQSTLAGAAMRVEATPKSLAGENQPALRHCSAVERWCSALAYTNGLEQGHDLRTLLNHYRSLEGAAVFRIVWDEGARVNPCIEVYPWRQVYIPIPKVGVQTCVFFKSRRAVFDVEQEFLRDESGAIGRIGRYKTLTMDERRSTECDFYDYWELGADGLVYNALLVDKDEFVIEPREMEGYEEVPVVVCPYTPTGSSDPLMACPPPVYFYLDLIDELETMLAQEQFSAHKEMATPTFIENPEGMEVPEIKLGGTMVVPLERGQRVIPPPPMRHMQVDKMMQMVMGMLASLGIPNVRSPYLSGSSAAIQASMAQKRLDTPAAQEEFAWSKVFSLAIAIAKSHGDAMLPTLTMPPQGARSVANSAKEFSGAVFGMNKQVLDEADVAIRVSIKPELPGEDMRKAQLLGTLRSAGVDWYTALQAAGFEQPEIIQERFIQEQFIMNQMILQALAMEYIQKMGLPMPMNVGGQPGVASQPRMEGQNANPYESTGQAAGWAGAESPGSPTEGSPSGGAEIAGRLG